MQLQYAAQWVLAVAAETSLANHLDRQQLDKRAELAHSPPFYPSPWMNPEADGWTEAYAKAREFVSQMTLLEKVNLTTGVG
jgi:beta-glucosidase